MLPADHERAADARQVRGQALGHAIDEIVLLGIAADIRERQHHDGQTRRRMRAGASRAGALCPGQALPDHCIGPHRTGDVLEVLLAHIRELDPDFAENLIVSRRRDADAARFGDALKPRRNIDAVAKNVVRLRRLRRRY